MLYRVIAAAVVVLTLTGVGYYVYTQYRDSRVDVIGALTGERYFYDEVPWVPLTTLPDAENLSSQLRAAVADAAPDSTVDGELLGVEASGDWTRVLKTSTGTLGRYGFAKTSASGAATDYALFRPDGTVRQLFDKRTIAVVAVPAADAGIAFGYFELRPKS